MGRKNKRGGKRVVPSNRNEKYGEQRNYTLTERKNESFEHYYKTQQIMPESEWNSFLETCQKNLPTTFRLTGNSSQAREVLKLIKGQYFSNMSNIELDGVPVDPPKCLQWFPNELAWQLNYTRSEIRKSETLKELHQFLVSETETGNISRQEAVSMLPPLVMDIKPHHKILDMCAAPGSKTAQLLEQLHSDESIPVPEGFVVANDSDNRRCYLMVHQVKRLSSPCVMIINHDASTLPNLILSQGPNGVEYVKYDRILADVPCSGDGTTRKNPDIWRKWQPGTAMNLHGLQIRLLKRGLDLLNVGGRLVYSTCSLNPIEDEAVIADVLTTCQGSVKLVDISSSLPGLKSAPGLTTWKVMNKKKTWYEKWEDVPTDYHTQMRPSMFPPTPEQANSLNLQQCIRILPHYQDTGGFFIAVLEKNADCNMYAQKTENKVISDTVTVTSIEDETVSKVENENGTDNVKEKQSDNLESKEVLTENKESILEKVEIVPEVSNKKERRGESPPPLKKQKLQGYKEDPFIFLKDDNEDVFPHIKKFFKLQDDFEMSNLFVRCDIGKKRNVYFSSAPIKNLVKLNEDKVKFINLGVKIFSRTDSPISGCPYRLSQEGTEFIFPFIKERKVPILAEDIVTLLSQENPYIFKMSDEPKAILSDMDPGAVIFVYEPKNLESRPQCCLAICGWRGKTSCRSFMPKLERSHYLRLCGVKLQEKEAKARNEPAQTEKESEQAEDLIPDEEEDVAKTESDVQEGTTDTEKDT